MADSDEERKGDAVLAILERALVSLDEVLPASAPVPRQLDKLRSRLKEGRFQLAILGQFKRGKSSVINALLGEALLPSGVIPLTAIATFIAWGERPLLRITYERGRPPDDIALATPEAIRQVLFGFVAEEANPKNRLGVARVDLFYPAGILKNGVVLIDTPGIGSSHRHNTDSALQVLPECDAALFVISPDPPITETELAYLETIRARVARLFFVLNKVDYVSPGDLETLLVFLRQTLREALHLDATPTIFRVSALAGLKAKKEGANAALLDSGIADIEEHLLRFLSREKLASLREAVIIKSAGLAREAEADLTFRIRTLEMPLADLAERRERLETSLARITAEARVIRDLLDGDRRRTIEQLESLAEELRQKGCQYLGAALDRLLRSSDLADTAAAQEAIGGAIPAFFDRGLAETARQFRDGVGDVLTGHRYRIDELVNLVRRTAADLFDVPYAGSAETEPFRLGQEPYWVTQKFDDRIIAIPPGLLDHLLSKSARRERIRARLLQQIARLVQQNVENLRWATLQALNDTFRRFAALLDDRLAEAIAATQGAVQAAVMKRASEAVEVKGELDTLRRVNRELIAIGTALEVEPGP
ncbi:MAG: dynamin family protein [Stellaceae bacterium]